MSRTRKSVRRSAAQRRATHQERSRDVGKGSVKTGVRIAGDVFTGQSFKKAAK